MSAFSDSYDAASRYAGGRCPIEAGVAGRLADHECDHGRLPGDRTKPCGCWPQETAVVIQLHRAPTLPEDETLGWVA